MMLPDECWGYATKETYKKCPDCKSKKLKKVWLDSEGLAHLYAVECENCGNRWTQVEGSK